MTSIEENKPAWVQIECVYQRQALNLTGLGIKCAFMNQPLEVTDLRPQLQSYYGLGTAISQRFSYADPMLRSLRQPVEQVLT